MATKKTTAARKTTPARKKQAPRATKSKTAASEITAETIHRKRQISAIVLFACAIFLACVFLIEGDSVWKWLHNTIIGIFGGWAILWPILMIYVSVITALDKPQGSFSAKVWLTAIINVLACATGFIFSGYVIPANTNFFEYTSHLFLNNTGLGGGVVGGFIGLPLITGAGELGAKIIIILLLFVAVMILTGTTLITLFKTVKKPVDVVSDGIQKNRQRREEERLVLDQQSDIDIKISDALPDHPVISENPSPFPKPEKRVKPKKDNDKLNRLRAVFGLDDDKDKQEFDESAPIEENSVILKSEEKPFDDITSSVNGMSPSFEEHKTVISETKSQVAHSPNIISEDSEAAEDAQKATAQFIKQHEESEKKETVALSASASASLYNQADTMFETYCYPPITMLESGKRINPALETQELQLNGRLLVETLKSFGVQTKILDICRGPSVTRYELQPAAGVKISKITNLADDLALNLAATGVRIEAPIPGKAAVGIEVPNKTKNVVRMRELIESNSFATAKSKLTVALGRDIAGQVVAADLAKMPHTLIAGTTGSGKSVCINSLIISVLFKSSPDEVRLLMIDPKVVELGIYNGIPHLLVPVVTDPRKAAGALNWAVTEMLKRYKIFADNNVRDLEGYNALAKANGYKDENEQPMLKMPQILIIIDELSDLMMAAPNEVEDAICRLAQMARAAGMHLVVATQRPSVDVVTGLIKANIPSRIAFAVSSAIDSRTILDSGGAEKLLGQGDMLFSPVGASKPVRVQGCYVSETEIESIVEFVKKSKQIEYDEKVIDEIEKNAVVETSKGKNSSDSSDDSSDAMMPEAIKCVVEAGQASTSLLQRRLRLGYARAGRLIDEMEQMGIVGPHEGSKPRQVLMTYSQWLEMNMQKPDENNEE